MNEQEIWKLIPNFPEYEVSNMGHIRSYRKCHGGVLVEPKILNGWERTGYTFVALRKNGKTFCHGIHQLVLWVFSGPCPPSQESRHLNGNGLDNRIENLKWGTRKENVEDTYSHGTRVMGATHPQTKLTDEDVIKIRELRASGMMLKNIKKIFPVVGGSYLGQIARRQKRQFVQ